MRTEVRTERKINFATFCPDPPIQASSWGGVGVSMCDGDDYSSEAVEVQLQVRSFFTLQNRKTEDSSSFSS